MSHTLIKIAEQLKESNKKVQLIYGFNGSGKTRLSGEFKELIDPKEEEEAEDRHTKVLYYSAFTEDLFYWDNDLEEKKIVKLLLDNLTNNHGVWPKQEEQNG